MKLFASVYIGSYEIVLKIFEISRDRPLKEVDCLRASTDVLRDVYNTGRVSLETTEQLCKVISDMRRTMKGYKVDSYRVYGGYFFGKAENILFVLDQIRIKTKMDVMMLTNSEHRFLGYEAVASTDGFEKLIQESAVMVDVGGASLQITYFKEGSLVTTQQVMLGAYSMHQSIEKLKNLPDMEKQIISLIDKELDNFKTMFLKGQSIKYLIILGDSVMRVVKKKVSESDNDIIERDKLSNYMKKVQKRLFHTVWDDDVTEVSGNPQDEAMLILHREILHKILTEYVVIPGVSVCEGIAYDYAYKSGWMKARHKFEDDVMSASWYIADRFGSYKPHLIALEQFSMDIFDAMKKYHGLTERERLLMRVVCVLHDCGKYISLSEAADCSGMIIRSAEILGLTHKEREMVAMVVTYNRKELDPYEAVASAFTKKEYTIIVKLLAILKVANAMDRSHKQRLKRVKMSVRNDQLFISIEADDSISLEKGLFREKADFFQRVFAIRPVIKEKRM